jgi:hypothetical protein
MVAGEYQHTGVFDNPGKLHPSAKTHNDTILRDITIRLTSPETLPPASYPLHNCSPGVIASVPAWDQPAARSLSARAGKYSWVDEERDVLRRLATRSKPLRCGEGNGTCDRRRRLSDWFANGNGGSSATRRRFGRIGQPIVLCCKDRAWVESHPREAEMTSQVATWNSPAMNSIRLPDGTFGKSRPQDHLGGELPTFEGPILSCVYHLSTSCHAIASYPTGLAVQSCNRTPIRGQPKNLVTYKVHLFNFNQMVSYCNQHTKLVRNKLPCRPVLDRYAPMQFTGLDRCLAP